MKTTGKIKDINFDYKTQTPMIVLQLEGKPSELEKLRDTKLSVEIKKHKNKRSKDANAYAWELIGKIADLLRADKDEIYFDLLKRYGQRTYVSVLSVIDVEGYFKYYSYVGESRTNGKSFKHYFVYKGSSEFDSREMAIFIDGVVYEARAMGIETDPPDKLTRLESLCRENGI